MMSLRQLRPLPLQSNRQAACARARLRQTRCLAITRAQGATKHRQPQQDQPLTGLSRHERGSMDVFKADNAEPSGQPGSHAPEQQQESSMRQGLASFSLADAVGSPGTLMLSLAALGAGVMGSGFSMEGPGSVVQALGVLAAIIAVHECGHFAAARLQGIHVTKFAIGFGPSLFSYKGGDVEYSLNLIPLGGYVAFPDDDPSSTYDPKDPNLLKNRGIGQRALVISAGVMANIVFALTVLLAQVTTVGKAESAYLPGVKVPEVITAGAAQRAGFLPGDLILRVGDYEVTTGPTQVPDLVNRIKQSAEQPLTFTVERDGTQLSIPCTPTTSPSTGKGAIGVSLTPNTYIKHIYPKGLPDALGMTASEFKRLASTVYNGLRSIFTNFSTASQTLSGPVAIVAAGSEIARADVAGLFQFCAIVNINLAAVNLLPLPALDGGYLALLFLEALRGGRKLNANVEATVMAGGLLLLMTLGVGLVFRDTVNLLHL